MSDCAFAPGFPLGRREPHFQPGDLVVTPSRFLAEVVGHRHDDGRVLAELRYAGAIDEETIHIEQDALVPVGEARSWCSR